MNKKELTKYFIKQIKEQQEEKDWIKNNFITVEQFLKPYTIKPNIKTLIKHE